MLSYKPRILLLALLLACAACNEKEDPCSEPSNPYCGELLTKEIREYESITDWTKIYDVTVNPRDHDEIAFAGQPEGYDDVGLFIKNMRTGELRRLANAFIDFRHIPDWGANGLILFPFRNNAYKDDGSYFGPIYGCRPGMDHYPKWCRGGDAIAYVADDTLYITDILSGATSSHGRYGDPFVISEDGTKLAMTDYGSEIYLYDLIENSKSTISVSNSTVYECDWMPDNHSLIYCCNRLTQNICGKSFSASAIVQLDLLSGVVDTIFRGCAWQYPINVKVSSDGKFVYITKYVYSKISEDELRTTWVVSRLNLETKREEYVIH